jgi:putative transposase
VRWFELPKIVIGRGYVYGLQYHLVWSVKYRRKVLIDDVEETLKNVIKELCELKGVTIDEMECDKDHIHLLVSLTPQHYIPDVIKVLKGTSARTVFKVHPEIKDKLWGGHLWNPSYFITTVGESAEAQIREYIRKQKEK